MSAYPQRKLWSERTCKYMRPLTRKRSSGMNARQANVQHAHGWGTDSRAVRNRSGERMQGWRKCLHGCSQTETWLTKILNGCSRTDTRVTPKFLNGLGRKDERLVGGVMCQVFLEQILSVSDSVRIQCIILRSRKSFACSCVKMRNENNCVFFNLLI